MPAAPRPQPELPGQEAALVDYVSRLSRFREGRRAVHLHLSQLQPYNRRDHHLRIAVKTFEAVVRLFEGQTFLLGNGDIVFIGNQATPEAIDEGVMRVRYLFDDDPMIRGGAADHAGRFATTYELTIEYDAFLEHVHRLHDEEMARRRNVAARTDGPAARPRRPIDPQNIAEFIDSIIRADLSNLMRRQSVCLLMPNSVPTPIFRELFISIPDLRDAVMPTVDLAADRGLFQYLTRTLDQRMLSLLRKNDDSALSGAFSLNLNVATLLSQEFLAFDADLAATTRSTIVVELQFADIVSDMEAFCFARDFAKARNYRLCLDAVTDLMMPLIGRDQLGVDFVKLIWSPRMQSAMATDQLDPYRRAVERFGRAHAILCRCDDEEAVRFGHAVGITMFQGRGVERLLGATSPAPRLGPSDAAALRFG
jgi:hypothetical protein